MSIHTHDDLYDAFADPAFAILLAELEAVAAQPPPAVGDELSAVLAGTLPLAVRRSHRRATSIAVIALLSGGAVAAGVGAAAADELPAPVQRVVSRVVGTLTPFEVPHPDDAPPRRDPAPVRPSSPAPAVPVVPDAPGAGLPAEAPDRTERPSSDDDDSPTPAQEEAEEEGDAEREDEGGVRTEPERESSTEDERGEDDGADDGADRAGSEGDRRDEADDERDEPDEADQADEPDD
jgi:hypothetical protein